MCILTSRRGYIRLHSIKLVSKNNRNKQVGKGNGTDSYLISVPQMTIRTWVFRANEPVIAVWFTLKPIIRKKHNLIQLLCIWFRMLPISVQVVHHNLWNDYCKNKRHSEICPGYKHFFLNVHKNWLREAPHYCGRLKENQRWLIILD